MKLSGKYLKINSQVSGERIVAGLFETPKGYYFFDVGWPSPGQHPCHFIGEIDKDNDEVCEFTDGANRFIVQEIQRNDPLYKDAKDWHEYAISNDFTTSQMVIGLSRDQRIDAKNIRRVDYVDIQ